MIEPYGQKLVNKFISENELNEKLCSHSFNRITVNSYDVINLINIASGCYSPLTGFMTEQEYLSVLHYEKLPDGQSWTLPILLLLKEKNAAHLKIGEESVLIDQNGSLIGMIHIASIFQIKPEEYAINILKTINNSHPGVQHIFKKDMIGIGGDVVVLKKKMGHLRNYHSPEEMRNFIKKKALKTITAFSTRNIPHIGHEFLHSIALENTDSLGINVITGAQVKGSFLPDIIFDIYEYLLSTYYPSERVFLNNLYMPPFYAGPKEAFMQAIMLQNLGFTHFIVGRDHAGVGNYYPTYGSQEIFNSLEGIKLKILAISEPRYCYLCGKVTTEKSCKHTGNEIKKLNGRDVRRFILEKRYSELANVLRPDLQIFLTRLAEQKVMLDAGEVKINEVKKIFYD